MFDDDRILNPLVLSGGSHEKGSGRGCTMNAISYVLGEEHISDFPRGVDQRVAILVQRFNDECARYAFDQRERNGQVETDGSVSDELFPHHAAVALNLGFMTIGTGSPDRTNWDVWDRVQADCAIEFGVRIGMKPTGHRRMLSAIYTQNTDGPMDEAFLERAARMTRFILTRFRFHAGLDTPTIPAPSAINEALRRMGEIDLDVVVDA